MADSQKYGRTANLFDDEIESGYYNDSGVLVSDSTASHSTTYIPVNGTTYTASGLWYRAEQMANFAVYEWDNNKNWLRRSNRQYPPSSNKITFTIGADTAYITLQVQTEHGNIMLNTGSTALPYEPYLDWVHSLRKLTTATDTITTLPADVYADGNNATVGLKGNTVQSGTPTPDNPIMPEGTGERTGNYLPTPVSATVESSGITIESSGDGIINVSGTRTSGDSPTINLKESVTFNGTYYVHLRNNAVAPSSVIVLRNGTTSIVNITLTSTNLITQIALSNVTIDNIQVYVTSGTSINTQMAISIEQTDSVTEYEPFGVKIPISSASTTTPVYLGEVETTRKIKKLKLLSSLGWNRASNGTFYTSGITDYLFEQKNIVRCSHFVSQINTTGTSSVNDDKVAFYFNNSQRQIREFYVAYRSITSLDEFKAFLNNNDVYIWYVLATETTGILNEPIRKIGDYADTVSGITIPTIAGANSFDVLTTLKPSEVTVNYKGWHDASVKEYDGSQWNE